jgi:hypothetical protein
MIPVFVQSRKTSFQHCATVSHLLEGDMSPKNASFTGAEMEPVLSHSHFLICIFGDTTDSDIFVLCSILPPLQFSILPPFEIFKCTIHDCLCYPDPLCSRTSVRICAQHSAPTPTRGFCSGHQLSHLLHCSVRSREPGTPLSALSMSSDWTVSPAAQSGGSDACRPQ